MILKSCEDCIHETVCPNKDNYSDVLNVGDYCGDFKDKKNIVEVVKCKDCKRCIKTSLEDYCDLHSTRWDKFYVKGNGYCNFGERR